MRESSQVGLKSLKYVNVDLEFRIKSLNSHYTCNGLKFVVISDVASRILQLLDRLETNLNRHRHDTSFRVFK